MVCISVKRVGHDSRRGTLTPSAGLIRGLNRSINCYGAPEAIRLDNASEMISLVFTEWVAAGARSCRFSLEAIDTRGNHRFSRFLKLLAD